MILNKAAITHAGRFLIILKLAGYLQRGTNALSETVLLVFKVALLLGSPTGNE